MTIIIYSNMMTVIIYFFDETALLLAGCTQAVLKFVILYAKQCVPALAGFSY
ncbi:hypothetical protein ACO0LO_14630 [Undibacterium sp. TJN25]|uniref:hypothetical protein n=1 Tax=Undibacterium sp. TJN25 TaxID=3413056 RepID=UPI003BF0946F